MPPTSAGFLLGSRQTLLETKDGGKSWTKRDISAAKEEGFNFRFTSISFQASGLHAPLWPPAQLARGGADAPPAHRAACTAPHRLAQQPWPLQQQDSQRGAGVQGDEGWIVGKPAILLHTTDGGKSWERIALSDKLPGNPVLITAVEGKNGQAEMTTDQGAVYVTDNAASTWKAAIQETVDATLNRTVSSGAWRRCAR